MDITLNLTTIVEIVGALLVIIVALAGYYRAICKKEINIYKLRIENLQSKYDLLRNQIPDTEPIINIWKIKVKEIQAQLSRAQNNISTISFERDKLANQLDEVLKSIETIESANDPLIKIVIHDLNSSDGLRGG